MLIALRILCFVLEVSFMIVLCLYVVRFYDRANSGHILPLAARKITWTSFGRSLSAFAKEWGSTILLFILRPLGWVSYPRRKLKKYTGSQTPVILLPGYCLNRSSLLVLGTRLENAGFNVYPMNIPTTAPIPKQSGILEEVVRDVLSLTGAKKVSLVGYSMGGLVSRYYVERLGGADRVEKVVTLGTPHLGSRVATLSKGKVALSMIPGSDFLADLQAAGLSEQVSYTAIWSDFDHLVLPSESAELEKPAVSIQVSGLGHGGILFSRAVSDCVLNALDPSEFPSKSSEDVGGQTEVVALDSLG